MIVGKTYRPNIAKGLVVQLSIYTLILILASLGNYLYFLIFSVVLIFAIIPAYLSLKVQSYELKKEGLLVKTGIIRKSQAMLPYSEIQDVQENIGMFENLLGIGNIFVVTMSQKIPLKLVYLEKSQLNEIKDFILSNSSNKDFKEESPATIPEKTMDDDKQLYEVHPVKKAMLLMFTIVPILMFIAIAVFFYVFQLTVNDFGFFGIFSNIIFAIVFTAFFGVFFFMALTNAIIRKISFRLGIDKNSIKIGSEFIGKYITNIPFNKLQDVEIIRGPFDRILKMARFTIETGETFVFKTSGNKHSKLPLNSISNLYENDARELRETVLKRSGIKGLTVDSMRERFPMENIKPLKKTVSLCFWLFVVMGILNVILIPIFPTMTNTLLLLLLIPVIVFPIKLVYEIFYLRSYDYSDNKEILLLRKGVLRITEVTVPYSKIQNIFIDQDIFDKLFGLYDVHLSTVGKISLMKLHIDGMNIENAENLKKIFKHRVK